MGLSECRLGKLIEQRREKYDGTSNLPIRGVSREGFILPKQEDADTSVYNVFYRNDFVFNPARMELNSIALNTFFDKAICSSLYEIFFVKDESILLPEYLNIYIKRDEFARKCWFEAIGSARNYFRVSSLSEFVIPLPPIHIQRKYVNIYKAMLANQRSYERGLEDLKLVCDGYIEDLRRKMPCERIGEFVRECNERNTIGFSVEAVKGIATSKNFVETKANLEGVKLDSYKVVRPGHFAYATTTSRMGDKFLIAHNDTNNCYLISPSYIVFNVIRQNLLSSDYLFMFFSHSEFDRYARFHSWGSVRENFSFDDMCNVLIPIPDISIQRSIANIYNVYTTRKRINEKLKAQIKNICPILIKGAIEESQSEAN